LDLLEYLLVIFLGAFLVTPEGRGGGYGNITARARRRRKVDTMTRLF
jgi:hypothetical protein